MDIESPLSTLPSRRTRKRLATRQAISDAATRLFFERGFDEVTVDDIANAADVGRKTVFNYFPRKEDMFFDLDEAGREELRATLRRRDPAVAPIEALRLFAHRIIGEQRPYVSFSHGSQCFFEVIERSEALKARARAIRDELAQIVAAALCESGPGTDDPMVHLAASVLVAIWGSAFVQAHRTYQRNQNAEEAKTLFLSLVDDGTVGLKAMMVGTLYA